MRRCFDRPHPQPEGPGATLHPEPTPGRGGRLRARLAQPDFDLQARTGRRHQRGQNPVGPARRVRPPDVAPAERDLVARACSVALEAPRRELEQVKRNMEWTEMTGVVEPLDAVDEIDQPGNQPVR